MYIDTDTDIDIDFLADAFADCDPPRHILQGEYAYLSIYIYNR